MPRLTFPLVAGVPLIDLLLVPPTSGSGTSASSTGGPVAVPAVIDTGAKFTCADEAALRSLGIGPSTVTTIRTASSGRGPQAVPVFEVSLILPVQPPAVLSGRVGVVAVDLSWSRYRCLLGRDVLVGCRFEYDGPGSRFTLEF